MSDPTINPSAPDATATTPARAQRSRSRTTEYAVVLAAVLLIVGFAFFQEPIGAFFRLRQWDRHAPASVVEGFMSAVQAGDLQKAQSLMSAPEMKPLMKNGKWAGYFMPTQAGQMDFFPEDMIPTQGPLKTSDPEFVPEGDAANVQTTVGNGKIVIYRLKMKNGSWKIAEIRGGRVHKK